MNLFQRHYTIVFIPVLILCAIFPALLGQSVVHDTSNRMNAEEIARRRKLVQTHVLEIEDKQKDWVETYHYWTFDAHETKRGSSNSMLRKDPVHSFMFREDTLRTESQTENIDFNVKQNMETGNFNSKPYVSSKMHLDHNNIYHCFVGSMKENFLHVIKELTVLKDIEPNMYNLPQKEITSDKNQELNYPVFTPENIDQVKLKKNEDVRLTEILNPVSKELHIRQKYTKSYISSLDEGKENWIETNHFSYKETESEEIFKYAPVMDNNKYFSVNPKLISKNIADVEPIRIQEIVYFRRWLKKLLNKLIGHPYTEHVNIVFSFTPDTLHELQKFSTLEKYEISNVDELISDLISNATFYNDNISFKYALFSSSHYYIIIIILLSVLVLLALKYYSPFRLLFILFVGILWHYYKLYQQKVAEKHAILSSSSPEYCDSILSQESGIFAHIKEYIRYSFYGDHCKKYFEALMIDPIAEISIFMVVSDFVSSSFFQLFRYMGSTLNFFVKDAFRDLGFIQSFYLIVVLIIIATIFVSLVVIYNGYKLNFPFFMGSLVPTAQLKGSTVEDIALEPEKKKSLQMGKNDSKSVIKKSSLESHLIKNNEIELRHHAEHYNFSLKSLQNDHQTKKISQSLKRRSSY